MNKRKDLKRKVNQFIENNRRMEMNTSETSQRLINFSKPTPDFNRKFYDLYSQKSMVDVILSAEGQFLYAHKVVLAVASSWFEVNFKTLKNIIKKLKINILIFRNYLTSSKTNIQSSFSKISLSSNLIKFSNLSIWAQLPFQRKMRAHSSLHLKLFESHSMN